MERILQPLHQLPDLAILAVVVFVVTAVVMAAPYLGRRVFLLPVNKVRDEAAFDAFKAVMSMTGVVLAFSLVQVNGNLRSAEMLVAKEATAIEAVDRILVRSNLPALAALRPLVAAYGAALVEDEWPLLASQQRSVRADDAYTELSKPIRSFEPDGARQVSIYNELLKTLDDVVELREQVLADSENALPPFFWITVIALLLLGFVLACLTDATLGRAVGTGTSATAIALLLAFVIIVDRPFEGQTSVKPTAITKALLLNARRS